MTKEDKIIHEFKSLLKEMQYTMNEYEKIKDQAYSNDKKWVIEKMQRLVKTAWYENV